MNTKEAVLALLLGAGDGRVSGESISTRLNLSRAAVNTAVQSLKKEGYEIESSTRTGYRLLCGPGRLREGELAARLGFERAESIICLDEVDSTNTWLKHHARELPAGTVCMSNGQTAGRGRLGRSFVSPKDTGIYYSYLFRPNCGTDAVANVTARTAAAVCRAIENACGLKTGIKWVNDVVSREKKLCGILTELSVEAESGRIEYVIVGIGINTAPGSYPGELGHMATCLEEECGTAVSRPALAAELTRQMDRLTALFPAGGEEDLQAYRSLCVTVGRDVCFTENGQASEARAIGIGEDFSLIVQQGEKYRRLRTGEVSVRGMYGYV